MNRTATTALNVTLKGFERTRRPKTAGRLRLDGLHEWVEIFRDSWGVPHIYAHSAHDLLFAQGFVHAQDRLWQMDFQRRVVAGRLAEVLGDIALQTDRGLRILGMYRVAEAEVGLLGDESRVELEAYTAGVNACIARQPLPVEFTLLRYQPEPWTPADSLCWAKMISWGLSINWETELLRARLIAELGPDLAAELEPPQPFGTWPIVTAGLGGKLSERSSEQNEGTQGALAPHALPHSASRDAHRPRPTVSAGMDPDPRSAGGSMGSNNWVLAGSRTVTGKPILANDMHLPLTAPAIWYENHLVSAGEPDALDVTGITFPGIPYVIAGHNGRVAWGFTNGYPDVQDLYMERLRRTPSGVQFEYDGEWHDAEVHREEIRVKGSPSVVQEVIVTRHGPIINELAPGLATGLGSDGLPEEPLALRWTSLDPATMVEALRVMNHSRTCDEFREALRHWVAPVQNVVYADTHGDIGYSYPGRVPIRAKGDGRVPVPGWTSEHEWLGYIPFDELPHQKNPASGYVISANNRAVDDRYPYFLGREFGMGDRAERILALVESTPRMDVIDIRRMHLDQISPSLGRLARRLASLEVADPALQGLVTLVKGWDGWLSADSPATSVCEVFGLLLQKVVMEAKLDAGRQADSAGHTLTQRVMGVGPMPGIQEATFFSHRLWEWMYTALERPDWHWFDLGGGERRDDVMRLALQRTYDYLQDRLGEPQMPDYHSWAWGRLHMLTFGHVAGRVPALAGHFNRGPYPVGGDGNTIFATGGGLTVEASTAVIGPPFRFIADLSDLSKCYGLLAPGNSGRPDSPHYDDQIEAWFKGQYHPMLYARDDVEHGARHWLLLSPQQQVTAASGPRGRRLRLRRKGQS